MPGRVMGPLVQNPMVQPVGPDEIMYSALSWPNSGRAKWSAFQVWSFGYHQGPPPVGR